MLKLFRARGYVPLNRYFSSSLTRAWAVPLPKSIKTSNDLLKATQSIEAAREAIESETTTQYAIDSKDVDKLYKVIVNVSNKKRPERKDLGLSPALIKKLGGDADTIIVQQTMLDSLRKNMFQFTHEELLEILNAFSEWFYPKLERVLNGVIKSSRPLPNNTDVCNTMLRIFAHQNHAGFAKRLLYKMMYEKIPLTDESYGYLAQAYVHQGRQVKIEQIIQDYRRRGQKVPSVLYQHFIAACLRAPHKDFKELAFETFEGLKHSAIAYQPNLETYNSMIELCAQRCLPEKAIDYFKELTTRPIDPLVPDSQTYLNLAEACLTSPTYYQNAWDYLVKISQNDLKFDIKAMRCLTKVCALTGNLEFVRQIFQKLCEKPRTYPDSIMFSYLMMAYANAGTQDNTSLIPDQAREAFAVSPPNLHSKNMPPFLDVKTFPSRTLMYAECRAIFKYLEEKHSSLISPHVVSLYLEAVSRHDSYKSYLDEVQRLTEIPFYSQADLFAHYFRTKLSKRISLRQEKSLKDRPNGSRILRNSIIYRSLMMAANAQKDLRLANLVRVEYEIWLISRQSRKFLPGKLIQDRFRIINTHLRTMADCKSFDQAIKEIYNRRPEEKVGKRTLIYVMEEAMKDNRADIVRFIRSLL
ncbi:hypothetical protein CANCADRAFT_1999 [Tortispora caseinolytica NRRL Y-17796]|uniref:Mitochondrial group I intron splicing factor CCM1 n=1 Tax=Tortispora caseinolytica NRRL Y-17796 TaxID=767744 RepID=A0A1E4TET7_9ASCO|nr:hypothetical protein CANCADRAFT_1999 [Tortispora caseinolytica NRRL Y-17796]